MTVRGGGRARDSFLTCILLCGVKHSEADVLGGYVMKRSVCWWQLVSGHSADSWCWYSFFETLSNISENVTFLFGCVFLGTPAGHVLLHFVLHLKGLFVLNSVVVSTTGTGWWWFWILPNIMVQEWPYVLQFYWNTHYKLFLLIVWNAQTN